MAEELRRATVLVVDDDESVRGLMATLLERLGVSVDCAADGESALRMLRAREYDTIVLDLMLPGTNGFEVMRHLRNVSPAALKNVVVVTAASDRTLRDFDDTAIRKLMRKPFDIDDFARNVILPSTATTAVPSS